MLAEVKVHSLGLDRANNMPVVILRECDGVRVLPIWIGPGEARAIATQLVEVPHPRPLTHDLAYGIVDAMGGRLTRVIVSRVEKSTYYAELVVERDDEVISVDARPSDSIALALRSGATILVADGLLQAVAIEVAGPGSEGWKSPEGKGGDVLGMGPEELNEHLRSLDPQDFGRFRP